MSGVLFFSPSKFSVGVKSHNCGGKATASVVFGLLWFSVSSFSVLMCVWGQCSAVVLILLHKDENQRVEHVSKEWSTASSCSGRSPFCVQLQQCFTMCLTHCGIVLSPICLLTQTLLLLPQISSSLSIFYHPQHLVLF